MTQREAKIVELMRKHTPFGYSDTEMLKTPIAVIALEYGEWISEQCAIASMVMDYDNATYNRILNTGKEDAE